MVLPVTLPITRRRIGVLAVVAVTLAGAIHVVIPPTAAAAAGPADHVVFWNNVLLQTYREVGGPPGPLARAGAMTVMEHWFGRDDIAFTGGTDDPHAMNVERDFGSFTAAADENAHSRLWLGVHFHFDADNVLNPGKELGEFTVDNSLYYNTSDTELLYLHKDNVTDPDECDNIGRQLSNEHRWQFWHCDFDNGPTSFDLYVR